jgi:acyl-CoA thioester hydrolase
MPEIYEHHHTVTEDEIDVLGHANNVVYIDWLQSAAMAHSAAQGWPGERYQALGLGWVVRSHGIEYLRPAFAGDRIVVRTWVATMSKAPSIRRYRILRPADGALLATAETRWAFINYSTRQPLRIPKEIAESFTLLDDDPGMENSNLELPKTPAEDGKSEAA